MGSVGFAIKWVIGLGNALKIGIGGMVAKEKANSSPKARERAEAKADVHPKVRRRGKVEILGRGEGMEVRRPTLPNPSTLSNRGAKGTSEAVLLA